MYTVIAFNFLRKFYAKEEDGEVEQNCHDLFTVIKNNEKSYISTKSKNILQKKILSASKQMYT